MRTSREKVIAVAILVSLPGGAIHLRRREKVSRFCDERDAPGCAALPWPRLPLATLQDANLESQRASTHMAILGVARMRLLHPAARAVVVRASDEGVALFPASRAVALERHDRRALKPCQRSRRDCD